MTPAKRSLALFLALISCLSLLSVGGLAAEEAALAEDALVEEAAEEAAVEEPTPEETEPQEELPELTEDTAAEETAAPEETVVPEETPAPEEAPVPADEEAPNDEDAILLDLDSASVGWQTVGGKLVYLASNGSTTTTGWKNTNGSWYYVVNGSLVRSTLRKIDGSNYFFDASGVMQTGWRKFTTTKNGKTTTYWSYFNSSGIRKENGWMKAGGVWYYFKDGVMAENEVVKVDGKYYSFDASGAMQTGWKKITTTSGNKTTSVWNYYYSDGSRLENGWLKSGGKWYYFSGGAMAENGTRKIDGSTYCFDSNGAMQTGWVKLTTTKNGKTTTNWSYYNSSGVRKDDGLVRSGNTWYGFKDGVMLTGRQIINGNTYYFYSDGSAYSGWQKVGSNWYYYDSTGLLCTGWRVVNGNTYYFYPKDNAKGKPEGSMAVSVTIDGYSIDSEGHAVLPAKTLMINSAQKHTSNTNWLIMVDTYNCVFGVFYGKQGDWKLEYYWYCSPGKSSTPTAKGVFSIFDKGYYFDSGSARCYYYSGFYNNQAIHSILYYQGGGVMSSSLGYNLSHGCIRLSTSNAKWVYDYCPVGTTVVVY